MRNAHKHTIAGNGLFMIFIAIALLGALTYIISKTSGSTEETGKAEQVSLQASDILKFTGGVSTAIKRLISTGCSENQIEFNDDPRFLLSNTNAPSDQSCNVFNTAGAGIAYIEPKDAWKDSAYTPAWDIINGQCVYGVGRGTTGCAQTDTDMLIVLRGISLPLCKAINRRLGIASVSGAPPSDEILVSYDPLFPAPGGAAAAAIIGDEATASALPLQEHKAGCLQNTSGATAGQYFFYQVLIER